MAKLHVIETRANEVKQDVVEILKEWLDRAEAGEFCGMAICGICPDGTIDSATSDTNDFPRVIGALALLLNNAMKMTPD